MRERRGEESEEGEGEERRGEERSGEERRGEERRGEERRRRGEERRGEEKRERRGEERRGEERRGEERRGEERRGEERRGEEEKGLQLTQLSSLSLSSFPVLSRQADCEMREEKEFVIAQLYRLSVRGRKKKMRNSIPLRFLLDSVRFVKEGTTSNGRVRYRRLRVCREGGMSSSSSSTASSPISSSSPSSKPKLKEMQCSHSLHFPCSLALSDRRENMRNEGSQIMARDVFILIALTKNGYRSMHLPAHHAFFFILIIRLHLFFFLFHLFLLFFVSE
ncbi:hypothetical protein PRIPAC_75844, partial [Pristionchus pacificus]|uniref:Uncharacterized protein n=1 Tax=Pristionchus pacificus TaxID=54126 RepID=A0A2A6CAQ5_PRIPA